MEEPCVVLKVLKKIDYMKNCKINRKKEVSGQVLLEFAIGLPLLMLLLFFIAESGYYLVASQSVPTALHDGAVLTLYEYQNSSDSVVNIELIEQAIVKSMKRPGVSNVSATVSVTEVGKKKSQRLRIFLLAEGDYKGVTPLKHMFDSRKLSGKLVLPIGDWRNLK